MINQVLTFNMPLGFCWGKRCAIGCMGKLGANRGALQAGEEMAFVFGALCVAEAEDPALPGSDHAAGAGGGRGLPQACLLPCPILGPEVRIQLHNRDTLIPAR